MAKMVNETDARLLNAVQEGVPLVERPFAEVGRGLGMEEEVVLRRLRVLKEGPRPAIRQISAIFDTKALGYRSTLVAAQVAPERIDAAAAVISRHPGVTHNYQRNHAFNLWYTLAVPSDSQLGLEKTLEILHRQSGAISTRMLPTLKLFKIGVRFNLSEDAEVTARSDRPGFGEQQRRAAEGFVVTEGHKRMIRALQQDLPLIRRPFDDWAGAAGVSVAELLEAARAYQGQSVMRRFGAVLHHREVGFSANAMGAWAVGAEEQESFGQAAARYEAVSHCYLRPTYPDWPYSIFTMVHARDEAGCRSVLEAISVETGVSDYAALFSSVQYKKVRLKYFTGEIEAWEAEYGKSE